MNKKSYIKNTLWVILLIIFVLLISFLLYRMFNSTKNNFKNQNLINNNKTIIEIDESLLNSPELYKDPYNYPYLIGGPIIKDIDNDGKIEKIIRYNLSMADRPIQVLYIYRNIDDEYKLMKAFYGDPYGFARMVDDNTIIVGRFLPVNIVN